LIANCKPAPRVLNANQGGPARPSWGLSRAVPNQLTCFLGRGQSAILFPHSAGNLPTVRESKWQTKYDVEGQVKIYWVGFWPHASSYASWCICRSYPELGNDVFVLGRSTDFHNRQLGCWIQVGFPSFGRARRSRNGARGVAADRRYSFLNE